MAKRLKIEDVTGTEIPGSFLSITGPGGTDAHRKRLVTVDCSRCGSKGTTHRLSQVLSLEITSCSCAERDANAEYTLRGVNMLAEKHIAIYQAVEDSIPATVLASMHGVDVYVIGAIWRAEKARVEALDMAVKNDIVRAALDGAHFDNLALAHKIAISAVRKLVSDAKQAAIANAAAIDLMERVTFNKLVDALEVIQAGEDGWNPRGWFTAAQFRTGAKASTSKFGLLYDTLTGTNFVGFSEVFRRDAGKFLKFCKATIAARKQRRADWFARRAAKTSTIAPARLPIAA